MKPLSGSYINNESDIFDQDHLDEWNNFEGNDENEYIQYNEEFDINNDSFINHDFGREKAACKRKPKTKVILSENAELFKNYYFSIFTKKKKFSKGIVREIHEFIRRPLKLPKMTRDEMRCSDLYFKNYEPNSLKILCFLRMNRQLIFWRILTKHQSYAPKQGLLKKNS